MGERAKKAWPIQKLSEDVDFLELFKNFPLTAGFPPNMLSELVAASEYLEIPPNSQILKQGQMNEHLYFLVDGQVGIYVDGGRVSKLQRRGDLLGEMSVISKQAAGATILSETKTSVIRVNTKTFLAMEGPERELYLSILYRIYATVLAEKLHLTNQKAKHFEELTINLQATQAELKEINQNLEKKVEERTQKLEQQNVELMTGKNKLEELINNKKYIFRKLSEFNNQYLFPLKNSLDELRKNYPDDTTISNARSLIFDTQSVLGPLADQYSSEQAAQGKRVLLADSQKKQQLIAKMALGGTGVNIDYVSNVEEGRAKLENENYDLVAIDAQNIEVGNLAKAKNPDTSLVLMTSDQIPSYLPLLKQLSVMPNIVSRDELDRTFTVKNIVTTVTKILADDLFGLEKYLSWGCDVLSQPIVSSTQRAQLVSALDAHFEKLGVRRANRDRIKTVIEEMLMNAIYDAPTDPSTGKAKYNHIQRSEEITLKPEEQGLVRYATDGMLIAISVQDPFGSLKGDIILRYLEANYSGTAADMNAKEGKGGAGRGLHMIVENSDLVVFNVDPGKKTEVIALFNVEVKEKAHQNPSFHLFIAESK